MNKRQSHTKDYEMKGGTWRDSHQGKCNFERQIASQERQYVGLGLWKKNEERDERGGPHRRYYGDQSRGMERLEKRIHTFVK